MDQLPFINGSYRTSPRRISWFARTFPSLAFHGQFLAIVLRAAIKAKWSEYDGAAWARSSQDVVRALESVGVQFEITGLEHLQQLDSPCLVIGNHMSSLETTVLPGIIRPVRKVTFVVKASLLEYPIFKHVMRSRDPVPVSQHAPRGDLKAMLTGGTERLQRGISMIIFPQGERTVKFEPEQFNSIGVKLARRAEVPIIPLAIDSRAWAIGSIISEFGRIDSSKKVHLEFGPPIWVNGRGSAEQQRIIQFISDRLQQWQK